MIRDIDSELTEVFQTAFGMDDLALHDDLTAEDVEAWDSVSHILLILAIEDRFGVSFTPRELEGFGRVGDLKAALRAKL